MKYSQDVVNNPPPDDFIREEVRFIKEARANYIAISPPIPDSETCQRDAGLCERTLDLTRRWVSAAREAGLAVWFRQKTFGYEGWYDQPKTLDLGKHLSNMVLYIQANPDLFASGDIFTPFPEPQNGGIFGVNCGDNCLFAGADEFNQWLVAVVTEVKAAFASINTPVWVGRFGFDGYIAWGDRNPDREKLGPNAGFITPATIAAMGNELTFDHYFPPDADPQAEYKKIRDFFGPSVNLCVGEWGAGSGESPERVTAVMQAVLDNGIACFNYWHLGPLTPPGVRTEALLANDNGTLVPTDLYPVVQQFFSK